MGAGLAARDASYIIAAVMVAPALVQAGVPDVAAHMFIFYYAVLSEVSPPTALSPFAAAALTGADPMRTTLHTWKYTLPAFVVPFMTLSERGRGLSAAPWPECRCRAIRPSARLLWWRRVRVDRRDATVIERVAAVGAGVLLTVGRPASLAAGASC
jgi:TRAP-type uncharacterized transport system fused permease subunit